MTLLGIVTNSGRGLIRDHIKGDSTGGISYLGIGTNATVVTNTDTTLNTEVYPKDGERTSLEGSRYGDRKARYDGNINARQNIGDSIVEFGFFNDATSGTMFLRDTPVSFSSKANTYRIRYKVVLEFR